MNVQFSLERGYPQKQPSDLFHKKNVLKNFVKFTGK